MINSVKVNTLKDDNNENRIMIKLFQNLIKEVNDISNKMNQEKILYSHMRRINIFSFLRTMRNKYDCKTD